MKDKPKSGTKSAKKPVSKSKTAKAAKTETGKKVVTKKPAVKAAVKPKSDTKIVKATPVKIVKERPADWAPDSTTAWAQKRGLKQIVIWGPEAVRDKVRVAAKRDGVPMSTWILDAVGGKLAGVKTASSSTKAVAKTGTKTGTAAKRAIVAKAVKAKSAEVDPSAAEPATKPAVSIVDDIVV